MAFFGLPLETAAGAVASALNNIGPGLAGVGPTLDYSLLPAPAKLFLAFYMILGRLEIFAICVLLLPSFWRISSTR